MTIRNEGIKELIPQREPFMMVDEFEQTGDNRATTGLTIGCDNYFILPGGEMAESGLIEHMAQSSAALVGWQTKSINNGQPRIGLIGEVKHFECLRRPKVGDALTTDIEFGLSFGNVTMATGNSKIGEEVIATIQMKIFMQDV